LLASAAGAPAQRAGLSKVSVHRPASFRMKIALEMTLVEKHPARRSETPSKPHAHSNA